jgi:hypothetical protein
VIKELRSVQRSDVITPVDTAVMNFLISVVHILYGSGEQETVHGLHLPDRTFKQAFGTILK